LEIISRTGGTISDSKLPVGRNIPFCVFQIAVYELKEIYNFFFVIPALASEQVYAL